MELSLRLVWREELATGVEEVDAQHRVMIDRVNELLEAAVGPAPRRRVAGLLGELRQDSLVHFDCEEGIMEARRCSVCATNRVAHREFLRDFEALSARFEEEGVTPAFLDQVHEKVCTWLTAHILAVDIALRETLDRDESPPA